MTNKEDQILEIPEETGAVLVSKKELKTLQIYKSLYLLTNQINQAQIQVNNLFNELKKLEMPHPE